jgi:hypothetical protein
VFANTTPICDVVNRVVTGLQPTCEPKRVLSKLQYKYHARKQYMYSRHASLYHSTVCVPRGLYIILGFNSKLLIISEGEIGAGRRSFNLSLSLASCLEFPLLSSLASRVLLWSTFAVLSEDHRDCTGAFLPVSWSDCCMFLLS